MGEAFLYLALRDPAYIGFPFVEFLAADEGVTRWQAAAALAPDLDRDPARSDRLRAAFRRDQRKRAQHAPANP